MSFGKAIASPFKAVGKAAVGVLDMTHAKNNGKGKKADATLDKAGTDAFDSQLFADAAADTSGIGRSASPSPTTITFNGDDATEETESFASALKGAEDVQSEVSIFQVDSPVAEFLVRDSTIIASLALCVGALAYQNLERINEGQIPFSVAFLSVILAYVLGRVEKEWTSMTEGKVIESEEDKRAAEIRVVNALPAVKKAPGQVRQDRRHSMFLLAAHKVTSRQIIFKEEEGALPASFWTNLMETSSHTKESWEEHANDPPCELLMARLKRNPHYSREKMLDDNSSIAETLEPLLKFRGFDVFLSETGEEEIGNHSLLTKCGLRDKPTFICNCLTPFANICAYYELPEWFEQFETICENDDDPNDVKALKRFLNGDDDYRNKRLKLYPTFISGPFAVRMLFSPPSKEFTIWGTMLPLTWLQHNESAAGKEGKSKSACLEIVIDNMSNPLSRKVGNIFRSYLKTLTVEVAIVIGTPDHQEEEEPEAFLGTFKLDGVDLATCPLLPPRTASETIREASVLKESLVAHVPVAVSKMTTVAEG